MYRHTSRMALVALVLVATCTLDARLSAQRNARGSAPQPTDPFLGTWVLDRAKSTFTGAVPAWRNHTFERVPTGIRHLTETRQGDAIYKLQYTFQVDGKDYPADIAMSVNMVTFKQVDANTLERTGKLQGEVLETVTYKLSADGKVMTITQDISANNTSSVQHFDKKP